MLKKLFTVTLLMLTNINLHASIEAHFYLTLKGYGRKQFDNQRTL